MSQPHVSEELRTDIRFAWRVLRKSPGRTAVLLATIAVTLGINAAVFSAVRTILIEPLPFSDSQQLAVLHQSGKSGAGGVSYPHFQDWRDRSRSFESAAVFTTTEATLTGRNLAERIKGAIVSASLFHVLRVSPLLGRSFRATEEQFGHGVVVISERLWQRQFSSSPEAIGRSVMLDGRPFEIIGVLRARDQFPIQNDPLDFWTTVAVDADPQIYGGSILTSRGYPRYDGVVARLLPGVTMSQARSEMNTIASQIVREHPNMTSMNEVRVVPALEDIVGPVRKLLFLIYAAAGCVLLVACANVAALFMLGNVNRSREFSIRDALGASRGRLARQLLTEYLLIAFAGCGGAILLAVVLLRVLAVLAPSDLPRIGELSWDGSTLLYSLAVALLVGVVSGFGPAVIKSPLKEDTRRRRRTGAALTVAQVALGAALTCCSAVLVHSFTKILTAARGFDAKYVLTAQISLPPATYPQQGAKVRRFYNDLLTRLRATPGVTSASIAQVLPLSGDSNSTTLQIAGHETATRPTTDLRIVEPAYFETLHIPLLQGRALQGSDVTQRPEVVVVNAAFAHRLPEKLNVLGAHIKLGWGGSGEKTIVGVVGDVRHQTLSAAAVPEVYVPFAQFPTNDMAVLVRTAGEPGNFAADLRNTAFKIDPSIPMTRVRPLADYLFVSSSAQQFLTALMLLFAAATLLLSAVGLYAVLGHDSEKRTREFGIRMAIGSSPSQLAWIVCRQAGMYAGFGLGMGLLLALPATLLLKHWLYETQSWDAVSFFAAAGVLFVVVVAATWTPAKRAAAVDPAVCLRME